MFFHLVAFSSFAEQESYFTNNGHMIWSEDKIVDLMGSLLSPMYINQSIIGNFKITTDSSFQGVVEPCYPKQTTNPNVVDYDGVEEECPSELSFEGSNDNYYFDPQITLGVGLPAKLNGMCKNVDIVYVDQGICLGIDDVKLFSDTAAFCAKENRTIVNKLEIVCHKKQGGPELLLGINGGVIQDATTGQVGNTSAMVEDLYTQVIHKMKTMKHVMNLNDDRSPMTNVLTVTSGGERQAFEMPGGAPQPNKIAPINHALAVVASPALNLGGQDKDGLSNFVGDKPSELEGNTSPKPGEPGYVQLYQSKGVPIHTASSIDVGKIISNILAGIFENPTPADKTIAGNNNVDN